jgi:hypothetical protein
MTGKWPENHIDHKDGIKDIIYLLSSN